MVKMSLLLPSHANLNLSANDAVIKTSYVRRRRRHLQKPSGDSFSKLQLRVPILNQNFKCSSQLNVTNAAICKVGNFRFATRQL